MNKSPIKLNIHEAKTHLSQYLMRVEKGESIILCRHNIPIAEIKAIPQELSKERSVGLEKGRFKTPESFFDPLPQELTDFFNGFSQ